MIVIYNRYKFSMYPNNNIIIIITKYKFELISKK